MPEEPSATFIGALANEQFGLQSVSGATISESSSRAALYFSSLSSGLVAVGFASSSPGALAALAFTVLPTIFALGWFTIVRLIDTSVQNIVALRRIEVIRRYWSTLDTRGLEFFPADSLAAGSRGVRYSSRSGLFTTATMVSAVNSVLLSAIAALVSTLAAHLPLAVAIGGGVVVGAISFGAFTAYQQHRLGPLVNGQ